MTERVPREVIPNPDPSHITNEAIDRAVTNSARVIDARIDGMQKAVEVFQADLTRVPTAVDRAISGLRELLESRFIGIDKELGVIHIWMDRRDGVVETAIQHCHDLMLSKIAELASVTAEQFKGVSAQFNERDTRTDQRAGDTKLAVDAAFAAAKEATSKIEAGFTKSIDGQQDLMNSNNRASDNKIGDLKDRLTAMEARTQGISAAKTENNTINTDNSARMFSIIAIILATLVGVGEIVSMNLNKGDGAQATVVDSLQRKISALETEQLNIARSTARNPVEKPDLDALNERLNALSLRLNTIPTDTTKPK
jgi:hypothetical protein